VSKKVALLVRSDGLSSKTSGFAILGANILRTASEPVWSRAVDHRFVQEPFIGAVLDAVMANYLIQGPPLSRLLLDSARRRVPAPTRLRRSSVLPPALSKVNMRVGTRGDAFPLMAEQNSSPVSRGPGHQSLGSRLSFSSVCKGSTQSLCHRAEWHDSTATGLTVMANNDMDGGAAPDLPAAGESYSSDLRDAKWARLEPMIAPARPGGRPRKTEMRAAMNAILYLLRTSCRWRKRT